VQAAPLSRAISGGFVERIVRIMSGMLAAALLFPLAPLASLAQNQPQSSPATVNELTAMLQQFLRDASTNNVAGFDSFFADDVIYTRSAGSVTTKPEIMQSVKNAKPNPNTKVTYSGEDITVHDYGDCAVIAFRLVGRTEHSDGKVEEAYYRNTGTFLRRNGKWQVVAWQATKIPEQPTPQTGPK
jgi:ketosteroid isomerase-like protein